MFRNIQLHLPIYKKNMKECLFQIGFHINLNIISAKLFVY